MKKVMKKLKNIFRKMASPLILILTIFLIILVISCSFLYKKGIEADYKNEELEKKLEELGQKQIQVDAIREEVKQISKFCAYEYNYTEVMTFSDQNEFKGIKIPLTGNNFIATIEGKMNIGIDGEKVEFIEIKDPDGKIVQVNLLIPKSEILDNYTDPESLEIYDERSNIFNPVNVTDYNNLLVKAQNTQKEKVQESDVLQKSDDTVWYLLKTYFQAAYGNDVKIECDYLDEKSE